MAVSSRSPGKRPTSAGSRARVREPRLLGRYHVLDELGRNAVGPIYLARLEGPQGFQRWAAIRCMDRSHLADDAYVDGFFERAREGAKLLHPNVAALFDVGKEDGVPWLAMEYLHGERVQEIIERLQLADTPAAWDIAARIIAGAAEGLHALHGLRAPDGSPLGLLHGDLAPHSVVVTYEGKAKIKGAFEPRAHGVLDPRKIPYAAPEQLWGESVDARADVFALGVLLWELVTGRSLFARDTDDQTRAMIEAGMVPPLAEMVSEVPTELDRIIRKALARRVEQRFATARELSRELESLLVQHGIMVQVDDVGRYMRTLFADCYAEREEDLQAASDVTEVFRRSGSLRALPNLAPRPEEDEEEEEETRVAPPSFAVQREEEEDRTTAERPAVMAPSAPVLPPGAPTLRDLPPEHTDTVTLAAPGPGLVMAPTPVLGVPAPPTPMLGLPAPPAPMLGLPLPPRSDEIPTLTAQRPVSASDEVPTLTGHGQSGPLFFTPLSRERDQTVTESAIFVAPRPHVTYTPPDAQPAARMPRSSFPSAPDSFPPVPSPFGAGPYSGYPPMSPDQAGGFPQPASTSQATGRRRKSSVLGMAVLGVGGGVLLFFVLMVVAQHRKSAAPEAASASASAGAPAATEIAPPAETTAAPLPTTASTASPDTASATASVAPPPPTAHATIRTIPKLDLTHPRVVHHTVKPKPRPKPKPAPVATSGKTGLLTIICRPHPCDQVLDGSHDLGSTPIVLRSVPVGKHRLKVRVSSLHVEKTVVVTVSEGKTTITQPQMP